MKLTEIERTKLANQYRILSFLDTKESGAHLEKALILENGIEIFYSDTVLSDEDAISPSITKETMDILDMSTYINNSITSLSPDDFNAIQKEIGEITFNGFDANNDKHYSMMYFLVEKFGRYSEYKDTEYNSHTQSSLSRYRTMLPVHVKLREGKRRYSKDDLITLYKALYK